jgi:hypothetical protein
MGWNGRESWPTFREVMQAIRERDIVWLGRIALSLNTINRRNRRDRDELVTLVEAGRILVGAEQEELPW